MKETAGLALLVALSCSRPAQNARVQPVAERSPPHAQSTAAVDYGPEPEAARPVDFGPAQARAAEPQAPAANWYCTRLTTDYDDAPCFPSLEMCTRKRIERGEYVTSACFGAEKAACLNFQRKLESDGMVICHASFKKCLDMRDYIVTHEKADIVDVGECEAR